MEQECYHNGKFYFDIADNKRCSNCDEIVEDSGLRYSAS